MMSLAICVAPSRTFGMLCGASAMQVCSLLLVILLYQSRPIGIAELVSVPPKTTFTYVWGKLYTAPGASTLLLRKNVEPPGGGGPLTGLDQSLLGLPAGSHTPASTCPKHVPTLPLPQNVGRFPCLHMHPQSRRA